MRLAVGLLLVMIAVPLAASLWPSPPAPVAPGAAKPNLPPVAACPSLNDGQRQRLADGLQQFAHKHGTALPGDTTDAALSDDIEKIDQSLQGGEPGRDPGRLRDLGPVQRQLRALCGNTASPTTMLRDLIPSKWWKNCRTKSGRNKSERPATRRSFRRRSLMANEWRFTLNGQPAASPVSWGQLKRLVADGQLQPTDTVWQEGMTGWAPAGSVKGLFPPSKLPPRRRRKGQGRGQKDGNVARRRRPGAQASGRRAGRHAPCSPCCSPF